MPTINEYSQGVPYPEFVKTNYNNDLEIQLMLKKQQEYDKTLSRLDNLRASALNISMINKKGKEKLDAYNQEINQSLSGDLGDLTDSKVQAKLANLFTKIGTDEDLKQRSKYSQYYQTEQGRVDQMKSSKDPTKSGYNPINEFVFRNWEGGLVDFMNADDINGWETKKTGYTPYKDIDQKLINITKLLKDETNITVVADGQGRLTSYGTKGVSKERISALLQKTLDQDELSQMEVLSKYRVLTVPKDDLYESYNNWVTSEKTYNKRQLDQARAWAKEYDPANVDKNLPENERKIKEEEYKAKQQYYTDMVAKLEESNKQLGANTITPEEWTKKNESEILPFIKQLTIESNINGIADALEHMDQIQKVTTDNAYFETLKINNIRDAMEWKKYMDQMNLKYKYDALSAKGTTNKGENSFSDLADQTADPQRAGELWNEMVSTNDRLIKDNVNIFSDFKSTEDLKVLRDPAFREKHSGNHYLELWDKYDQHNDGQGLTLEGFNAFVEKAKNGDFYSTPSIQGIVDNLNRDQQVQSYYQENIAKVNNVLEKEGGSIFDIQYEGHTLREYAQSNKGVNANGEMVFGVRDGHGGFKQMTWKEVKEEYQKGQDRWEKNQKERNKKDVWGNNVGVNTLSGISSSLMENFPEYRGYEGILSNDKGFFNIVKNGIEAESKQGELLQKVFNETVPAFAQFGYRSTSDSDFIEKHYLPLMNQSYKLSDGTSFQFTKDQVKQVNIPAGNSTNGTFVLSKAGAESISELGIDLYSPTGEKISSGDLKEGLEFKFNVPAQGYDFVYNQMLKDRKRLEITHKGYKVAYNLNKSNPSDMTIFLYDPSGQIVLKKDAVYKSDINDIESLSRQAIEEFIKSKNAKK